MAPENNTSLFIEIAKSHCAQSQFSVCLLGDLDKLRNSIKECLSTKWFREAKDTRGDCWDRDRAATKFIRFLKSVEYGVQEQVYIEVF